LRIETHLTQEELPVGEVDSIGIAVCVDPGLAWQRHVFAQIAQLEVCAVHDVEQAEVGRLHAQLQQSWQEREEP
jgi:hypothetical protein